MAWFRVRLTEEEQRVVNEERCCHPNLRIREKMLVLWLLHIGLTRQQAAKACRSQSGPVRPAVRGRVSAGGLGRPAAVESQSPGERDGRLSRVDRRSFEKQPATTIAEACERIFQLTGLRRGRPDGEDFLKDLGLKFYRVRAIPVPPKKNCRRSQFVPQDGGSGGPFYGGETYEISPHVTNGRRPYKKLGRARCRPSRFLETELKPLLAAAQAGKGHVFFVDAAHFVFGTFLCYLWSFTRIFVRAASGRQRFNVLGAWNAVTAN